MPIKKYGIYTAYPPTVDMRKEGLGRYLAAFVKGASENRDIQFILICPSWSIETLEDLFSSEDVPKHSYQLVAPKGKPFLLRIYEAYNRYQQNRSSTARTSYAQKLKDFVRLALRRVEHRITRVYSFKGALLLSMQLLLALCASLLLLPVLTIVFLPLLLIRRAFRFVLDKVTLLSSYCLKRFQKATDNPKEDAGVLRLFNMMNASESERMQEMIEALDDVIAWYSPTAFWPDFNKINKPRLMCVPDVVLSEFSIGFSVISNERLLPNYELVENSIRSGANYVVYSQDVKWNTLVDRYNVPAESVNVVHHAPNDLSRWVTMTGFDDDSITSKRYCESLLAGALRKSSIPSYLAGFANSKVDFLFYASQFRPNKNILSMLRAYEYLLRKKFIRHKLILTGNSSLYPIVDDFLKQNSLENDVLCLHGLSIQELAAGYKLADLAINPSLSEGGAPFTFTEALSVDTPVVMARIPVTEEVLSEPQLQDLTLFDPYDWKSIADKIMWALENREELLTVQRDFYLKLSQRTWAEVVNEHIDILDHISENADE